MIASLALHNRAAFSADAWWIELAIVVDGTVVGLQGMFADDFPTLRSITTGRALWRKCARSQAAAAWTS